MWNIASASRTAFSWSRLDVEDAFDETPLYRLHQKKERLRYLMIYGFFFSDILSFRWDRMLPLKLPASLFCTLCGIWTVRGAGIPGKPGGPGSPVIKPNLFALVLWKISTKAAEFHQVCANLTLVSFGSWVPSLSLWTWASWRAGNGAVSWENKTSRLKIFACCHIIIFLFLMNTVES